MTSKDPRSAYLIERYRRFLPVTEKTPVVSLAEGSTPLLPAPRLGEQLGIELYLKLEGLNPTGSFKDRGMTLAASKGPEEGRAAVICASTGHTSAAQAACAARPGRPPATGAGPRAPTVGSACPASPTSACPPAARTPSSPWSAATPPPAACFYPAPSSTWWRYPG